MSFTRYRLIFTLALLAGSASAMAQTTPEEHAAQHPAQQSAPAGKLAPSSSDEQKAIKEMQSGAAAMQALMDQIENTKDPAERKKLLEQHHRMMLKQTQAMEHMSCGMEMSGGMSGADPGPMPGPAGPMGRSSGQTGRQGGMMGMGAMQCHQLMQARMNMMARIMEQMMLEQMMEHVRAE